MEHGTQSNNYSTNYHAWTVCTVTATTFTTFTTDGLTLFNLIFGQHSVLRPPGRLIVHCSVWQWKNVGNQSIVDEDMDKSKVARF